MFETTESAPRDRSLVGLIIASILLPPLGIVLLWMRRDTATATKIGATSLIAALGPAMSSSLFNGAGLETMNITRQLEQHRAQQQQGATQSPVTARQPNAPDNLRFAHGTSNEVASAHADAKLLD
jgi:hypothetical protein